MRFQETAAKLIMFAIGASLVGCASVPTKTKEYEVIKKTVTQYHDAYLFGPDKPYLTENSNVSAEDRRALISNFSETYFAADMKSIAFKCQSDPLICTDPTAFEVLFRELHNANIRISEQEKLQRIDDWYHGKLTDKQLEGVLHFELKFDKGELVVQQPS